jgi:phosphoribosylformimino-5-aminoimidazole carboxamide ribotide isomerase
MILYPAIDLRDGGAVRLTQGDFERETRYGDPLDLAATYVAGGASWIHVVDLNAARTGTPHERATLGRIVEIAAAAGGSVGPAQVQTGGGIRTEADVSAVLELGAARVVLGTAALEEPALATRCARRFPGQVAVGLDYVVRPDGVAEARGHGWVSASDGGRPGRPVSELVELWAGEPIGAVVATAIARDGMLGGSDLEGMRTLLALTDLPVIASGGVAGVIVGKALVEGRFTMAEAVAACAASV